MVDAGQNMRGNNVAQRLNPIAIDGFSWRNHRLWWAWWCFISLAWSQIFLLISAERSSRNERFIQKFEHPASSVLEEDAYRLIYIKSMWQQTFSIPGRKLSGGGGFFQDLLAAHSPLVVMSGFRQHLCKCGSWRKRRGWLSWPQITQVRWKTISWASNHLPVRRSFVACFKSLNLSKHRWCLCDSQRAEAGGQRFQRALTQDATLDDPPVRWRMLKII